MDNLSTSQVQEALIEIKVNAALAGHEIGDFLPHKGSALPGYQTTCRSCGQTAWVGEKGLMYSLLDTQCR